MTSYSTSPIGLFHAKFDQPAPVQEKYIVAAEERGNSIKLLGTCAVESIALTVVTVAMAFFSLEFAVPLAALTASSFISRYTFAKVDLVKPQSLTWIKEITYDLKKNVPFVNLMALVGMVVAAPFSIVASSAIGVVLGTYSGISRGIIIPDVTDKKEEPLEALGALKGIASKIKPVAWILEKVTPKGIIPTMWFLKKIVPKEIFWG